jgi:hypothetical protein
VRQFRSECVATSNERNLEISTIVARPLHDPLRLDATPMFAARFAERFVAGAATFVAARTHVCIDVAPDGRSITARFGANLIACSFRVDCAAERLFPIGSN